MGSLPGSSKSSTVGLRCHTSLGAGVRRALAGLWQPGRRSGGRMMARSVAGIHRARFGPVPALVRSCSCGAGVVVTSKQKRPRGEGGARTGVVGDGSERWWADQQSEGVHDRDRCEAGGGLFGEDLCALDDGDRHDRGVGRAENDCRGEGPPRAPRASASRTRGRRPTACWSARGPEAAATRCDVPSADGRPASAGAVLMLVRRVGPALGPLCRR